MPTDTTDLVLYRKDREGNTLRVSGEGDITLTTTGGANVNEDEYGQIAEFVEGRDGAEAFLAKLQKRMER